jgi:hypothetical protein
VSNRHSAKNIAMKGEHERAEIQSKDSRTKRYHLF